MSTAKAILELDTEALYVEHGAFIGRVLQRVVGDGPHVDDLLQETFIVAFRKRHSFDPARAAPRTWLYGIAMNLGRRHRRSVQRFGIFRARLARAPSPSPPEPDRALEQREDDELVQAIIETLPLKQREVFILYELEELDGPEIAALVGVPIGTVWSRLHHARKKFEATARRRLEEARS